MSVATVLPTIGGRPTPSARSGRLPLWSIRQAERAPLRATTPREEFYASIVDQLTPSSTSSTSSKVGLWSGGLVAGLIRHVSVATPTADIVFRPLSQSTTEELKLHNLPIADHTTAVLDVVVDQADQVDTSDARGEVWWVVGRGENGPQVSQVDIQALKSTIYGNETAKVIVLTRCLEDGRLRGTLPVMIDGDELEWEEVAEEVDDLFVTDAEITRRSNQEAANTRGFPDPVIVENADGSSSMTLDVAFFEEFKLFGQESAYREIENEVEGIEGVLAAGLVGVSRDRRVVVWRVADAGGGDDDDAFEVTGGVA